MLDPVTIMRLAELRQKEIRDSIVGVCRTEPAYDLWATIIQKVRDWRSPEEPPDAWEPPRPIRHSH